MTLAALLLLTACGGRLVGYSVEVVTLAEAERRRIGPGGYHGSAVDQDHLQCVAPGGLPAAATPDGIEGLANDWASQQGLHLVNRTPTPPSTIIVWACEDAAEDAPCLDERRAGQYRLSVRYKADQYLKFEIVLVLDGTGEEVSNPVARRLYLRVNQLLSCQSSGAS
jgi:hypothetical protein